MEETEMKLLTSNLNKSMIWMIQIVCQHRMISVVLRKERERTNFQFN